MGNKTQRKKPRQNKNKSPLRRKIALIGFRGIGKTTLSQLLGNIYKTEVISLDKKIEDEVQMSIEEFVKKEGWAKFRELEKKILKEIAQKDGVFILDTGGGVVEDPDGNLSQEKIDILKNSFFCIYLTMPDQLLLERLSQLKNTKTRPDLPGGAEKLPDILEKRKPMYLEAAHAVVDISSATPAEAAERIRRLIG
ncbi:MAG: shikimate kinase [Leptospiraceae bacterium]|nr:shikimate kinase [Leptospiraceae bacterium]MDW8306200.1 shikimate kinase [Leptospiraceae bacterium]